GATHEGEERLGLLLLTRGEHREGHPGGAQRGRVLQMPGRQRPALALPLMRGAVPPHVLVDEQLNASLEEAEEGDRAVLADHGRNASQASRSTTSGSPSPAGRGGKRTGSGV